MADNVSVVLDVARTPRTSIFITKVLGVPLVDVGRRACKHLGSGRLKNLCDYEYSMLPSTLHVAKVVKNTLQFHNWTSVSVIYDSKF